MMEIWHRAAAILAFLMLAACSRDNQPQDISDSYQARQILYEAVEALRRADSVSYDFEWGGEDNPTGWVTGHTKMRRITDTADSWYRVEGVVREQPAFGVSRIEFMYATDGSNAWARDGAEAEVVQAPVGDGASSLATTAVYGFLPEFIEAHPFWKELGMRSNMRMLEPESIDGVVCDVVEIKVFPEVGEPSDVRWSIARDDRLPRRGRWSSAAAGPTMIFTVSNLVVEPTLPRSEFDARAERVASRSKGLGVGSPAPTFALATAAGGTVQLDDLSGQVVVLDFWNTWCFLCRSIAPATWKLAADLSDEPVQFLGINVFETGDPIEYWQQAGSPYPLLLAGDSLARSLDLPWQPGVAVLGPDGTILYKELGASPDRAEKIRHAVEQGLERR